MQPSEMPLENYIPIEEEHGTGYSSARIIRNRSRQGYLENGRRSRGTDEENSQRSSLIAAADEEGDEEQERGRRAYDSDDERSQSTRPELDSSFSQRRVPYMGRRVMHNNSNASHETGVPRRPNAVMHRAADCV
uniref:Uncharacterized protein n=1 Tax=Panagrolaimus sp. ES5 TaxID=591445 RepID=A0AC34FGH8_9BILA